MASLAISACPLPTGRRISTRIVTRYYRSFQDPKQVDPKLICPIFDILCPCLPQKIKEKRYFGVQHENKYDAKDSETDEPILLSNNPKPE